jgi:ABC-type transporter Mla subunit MlaD
VAGRGQDLNAAIRRGVPALREFDQVLAILAQENHTLADLTKNADTTVKALADNHRDVGRWIVQARNAAADSAAQRGALADTWKQFPPFLEQLTPAMRSLGQVADQQTPALRNLSAAAPDLKRFFADLGPFAQSSRPAFRALGKASQTGLKTVRPATATVSLLRQLVKPTPELSKNLAIVLNDLNDRGRATEPDPRSPTGKGFTGLEALLEYVFNQTQAINMFDSNGYILRASVFSNECSPYTDAVTLRKNFAKLRHCASFVGPNQPDITGPDPAGQPTPANSSPPGSASAKAHSRKAGRGKQRAGGAPAGSGAPPSAPGSPSPVPAIPGVPSVPVHAPSVNATQALLNFLLSP